MVCKKAVFISQQWTEVEKLLLLSTNCRIVRAHAESVSVNMCIVQTRPLCIVAGHSLTPLSVTDKAIDFSKEPAAYVRDDRYMLLRAHVEGIANTLLQINKWLLGAN